MLSSIFFDIFTSRCYLPRVRYQNSLSKLRCREGATFCRVINILSNIAARNSVENRENKNRQKIAKISQLISMTNCKVIRCKYAFLLSCLFSVIFIATGKHSMTSTIETRIFNCRKCDSLFFYQTGSRYCINFLSPSKNNNYVANC